MRASAGMQVRDLPGRLGDPGAQVRGMDDLDLGPEGEHVEDRGVGRVNPHPGRDPVLPAGRGTGVTADPDAARPAEQRGETPTARRQAHSRSLDTAIRNPLLRPVPGGRQLAGEPVQQLEAAEPATDGVDRYPGAAEGLDVAQDRARRYLKLA